MDMAELSQDERDQIGYCFDQNVKKIENVSPKIAAGLRTQREAMLKWAGIAKGTFPETRTYSYPGQTGGLGVDFLNPYLFGYGTSNGTYTNGTDGVNMYLDIAGSNASAALRTWDFTTAVDTRIWLMGKDTATYYRGCATTGSHSFVVLFQDGILEVGSDPSIDQIHFKSELMDKYTPIQAPPTIRVPIEDGKSIFQYNTPGMIPCSHQTGMNISVAPLYARTIHVPLLGMCFYESGFNLETMVAH
jgi:hypothetical protein